MQDGLGGPSIISNTRPTTLTATNLNIQPTSVVSIKQSEEDIIRTWVIDTELDPPLDKESSRPWNVCLSTRASSLIDATVFVLPLTAKKNTRRQLQAHWNLMYLQSGNSISLNLHETAPGETRRPFYLVLSGAPISLSLPRSWSGPLQIYMLDVTAEFSPGVEANISSCLTEKGTKFLGDSGSDYYTQGGFKAWKGDRLAAVVWRNGAHKLKVRYEDEVEVNRGLDGKNPDEPVARADGKEDGRLQDGREDVGTQDGKADVRYQDGKDDARLQDGRQDSGFEVEIEQERFRHRILGRKAASASSRADGSFTFM